MIKANFPSNIIYSISNSRAKFEQICIINVISNKAIMWSLHKETYCYQPKPSFLMNIKQEELENHEWA